MLRFLQVFNGPVLVKVARAHLHLKETAKAKETAEKALEHDGRCVHHPTTDPLTLTQASSSLFSEPDEFHKARLLALHE